ncbi:RNA polymerase sigma factor [Nocardioides litoris]|uniref:RNA polymerase sigma factor n=1 Tax=Nocardioides litoris TaxID=1926648 RepID=UPI001121CD11|nr:RNA polymerase sigma factor [Nocardioides litoris]
MAEDDEVVAAAKRGEPEAWAALYRAHAARLLAWLRTRPCADTAVTADDVAAEAWLVAASKVADFSGDTGAFAGWLFGIARKVQGSSHRRAVRRATDATDPSEAGDHLPVEPDPTLVLDDRAWVREAIASLPPRERDAVGLVDAVGLSQAAAAEALGVSTVALRVARHRGLRRLRRVLGVEDGAPRGTTEPGDPEPARGTGDHVTRRP